MCVILSSMVLILSGCALPPSNSSQTKGIEVDVEMAAQIIRVAIHGLASSLITTSKCYPWKDPQRMKEELIATVTRQFE